MRAIFYAIFNKETNERIYTDRSIFECEKMMATLKNKENFEIRHKWFSI